MHSLSIVLAVVGDAQDQECIEDEMTALKHSLECHCQELEGSHKYFMDVTKKCSEEWAEIVELEGCLS